MDKDFRRFNAELIRNFGYVLCTPICIKILNCLVDEKSIRFNVFFLVSLVFLFFGVVCIQRSYDIMDIGEKTNV